LAPALKRMSPVMVLMGNGKHREMVVGNRVGHLITRGDLMNVTMRDEDCQAMDLVLDRNAATTGKGPGYAASDGRIRERVSHVESVLAIFSNLEAGDPPRNLHSRTIRFVEQSAGCDLRAAREDHTALTHNQPPVA